MLLTPPPCPLCYFDLGTTQPWRGGGRSLRGNWKQSLQSKVMPCFLFIRIYISPHLYIYSTHSLTPPHPRRPHPLAPPCSCAPAAPGAWRAAGTADTPGPSGSSRDGSRRGTLETDRGRRRRRRRKRKMVNNRVRQSPPAPTWERW